MPFLGASISPCCCDDLKRSWLLDNSRVSVAACRHCRCPVLMACDNVEIRFFTWSKSSGSWLSLVRSSDAVGVNVASGAIFILFAISPHWLSVCKDFSCATEVLSLSSEQRKDWWNWSLMPSNGPAWQQGICHSILIGGFTCLAGETQEISSSLSPGGPSPFLCSASLSALAISLLIALWLLMASSSSILVALLEEMVFAFNFSAAPLVRDLVPLAWSEESSSDPPSLFQFHSWGQPWYLMPLWLGQAWSQRTSVVMAFFF